MTIFDGVLVLATFLCSLVAGFLFAFAAVVMSGIGRLDDGGFIRAFQVIDRVIQRNQPRGITVNTVQPGPTVTDMNPGIGPFAETMKGLTALGRYADADEIAGLVAYLAGPEAAYVTGASLTIDGGYAA